MNWQLEAPHDGFVRWLQELEEECWDNLISVIFLVGRSWAEMALEPPEKQKTGDPSLCISSANQRWVRHLPFSCTQKNCFDDSPTTDYDHGTHDDR